MQKTYSVTCKKCKGHSIVVISNDNRIYWKKIGSVISGRFRLDGQWGWQCSCGINELMSQQESKEIADPVNPDPMDIEKIIKNLKVDTNLSFEMKGI